MTTATDSPEVEQLKTRNLELGEEVFDLVSQVEALRGQLAEVRCLTPYDMPGDVLAVLELVLTGWPERRWSELAKMIEETVGMS